MSIPVGPTLTSGMVSGHSYVYVFSWNGYTLATNLYDLGLGAGEIPTALIPLSCMDLTMLPPFTLTGTTLSIALATGSLPGLMTAAQFSSVAALGTASTQATGAFATSAQGTLAASALQSNQAITLSGDATGSGTTAITVTLASVGTAGIYSGVTTDAKGRVTAGTSRSTSSTSRAISTTNNSANGYQASSSRDSWVSGEVQISTTATIGSASAGSIILERCATNSTTGGSWTEIDRLTNNQTITLAIALNSIQAITASLRGYIPPGWFYRYRSLTPTGTVTYSTTTSSEEVLL